jgi:hypothetical protein
MAYFPSYDLERIENDASNNFYIFACVFIAAVMFIPNHCLVITGGYTYRQTDGRDSRSMPLRWAQVT